jgi:hypothetical protein
MLRMTNSLLLLVLYVDDLLIISFLTTNMGPLHFFLGLDINQDASTIKMSQTKYAQDVLERFHMADCKSSLTPFLSRVKLEDSGDTPLVEYTLYK